MSKESNSLTISGIAKTITDIMGIGAPNQSKGSIDIICAKAMSAFGDKNADRVFIYNPDAIALWLFQKYTSLFEDVLINSDMRLPMRAVMPSVTPVCFATMYTGAEPSVHGITAYEKPVLKADTVFDALIRAGLKPAIVSTTGDSTSCIFLDRKMDYFIFDTTEECNEKALELIKEDKHDLILLYNPNYDNAMHKHGTESNEALKELKKNVETYSMLVAQIEKHWTKHRTMIGFCPDHGCHDHELYGQLGGHGLDIAEDMNVIHFFKFI